MPQPLDDLNQIGFLLGRAYYTYIGFLQRWIEEAGLDEHIKPGMGSLLFALFRADGRTMTDLAQELQLAKSTLTGMVARMRGAGLVVLVDDPQDGRLARLRLTPLARSLERRCRKLAERVERHLGRGLDPERQEALRSILVQVTQTMTEELQRRPKSTSARSTLSRSETLPCDDSASAS